VCKLLPSRWIRIQMSVRCSSPMPSMADDEDLALPRPQTARRWGCKGARNARKPATNPCSATGASGRNLRSFASHAKLDKAGANRKCGQDAGTIDGPLTPTCARDFPSLRTGRVSPVTVGGTDPTGTRPWLWGQSKIRDGAEENCKPTMPSGGSPLAVLGVNLGHENGSERELSLPSLPRQFAQIATC
jgi:hypothetical protein